MAFLFNLFISFFKIGIFTFGGGYAMLPMLQRELVDKRGWVTEEEILDYFAIGQCTPGVIAVNTATFVGYKKKGVPGAIFSTLGLVFPSLIIILTIAAFLSNFAELEIVKNAFAGIRAVVCVLILNSTIKLWKQGVKDKFGIAIFIVIFLLTVFTDISKIIVVILAGIAGYVATAVRKEAAK